MTPSSPSPAGGPDPTQQTVTAALLRLQHRKGWLSDDDLRMLAAEIGQPLHRLEEVVSFFPHFRRETPPRVELAVCRDMSCHLRGAPELTRKLTAAFATDPDVHVKGVSCLGRCDRAPAACASRFASAHGGDHHDDAHDLYYHSRDAAYLTQAVNALRTGNAPVPPDLDAGILPHCGPWRIDVYNGNPTYEAAKQALRQIRQADDVAVGRARMDLIPKLELSGLRGMGGAGAPAAKKWKDVRSALGDVKYVVCNADESEPATFKDRELMLRTPWLVVEGVILAGLALGASRGYIYLRHEYPEQAAALWDAIRLAEQHKVCGKDIGGIKGLDFPVAVYISPGGYICGEQSALIEAMEGKRAQPRNRPPELGTNGLFDKPTLVNNVETLAWVPGIMLNTVVNRDNPAAQLNWYADFGRPYPDRRGNGRGIRFFSISGDVNRPGVYETPIGAPMRVLLEAAGGVVGGYDNLKAIATSGPSGGFVPRTFTVKDRLPDGKSAERTQDLLDLELDIDAYRGFGGALGAGLVVYAGNADLLDQAVNATEFFRNESCGKCVPCRVGSQKLVEIGGRLKAGTAPDLGALKPTVRELERAMEQTSICGLGQVVPKPLSSLLTHFEADAKRTRG